MFPKTQIMGYNERLFGPNLRGWFHRARFRWLRRNVNALAGADLRVIELGCFDGKTLAYLPPLRRYLGLDANWEDGLELARQRWPQDGRIEFRACRTPAEMRLAGEEFDVGICLETLEHLPPALAEDYLRALLQAIQGYLLISVPNEKGLIFLGKYLARRLWRDRSYAYTLPDVVNSALGRLDRVSRYEHKGFDYARLAAQISQMVDLHAIHGIPFASLPPSWNFGVGMIGKIRR